MAAVRWFAECTVCSAAASAPTDWQVERWADKHVTEHPDHTVDVDVIQDGDDDG